jgi:hypothetical protein
MSHSSACVVSAGTAIVLQRVGAQTASPSEGVVPIDTYSFLAKFSRTASDACSSLAISDCLGHGECVCFWAHFSRAPCQRSASSARVFPRAPREDAALPGGAELAGKRANNGCMASSWTPCSSAFSRIRPRLSARQVQLQVGGVHCREKREGAKRRRCPSGALSFRVREGE